MSSVTMDSFLFGQVFFAYVGIKCFISSATNTEVFAHINTYLLNTKLNRKAYFSLKRFF